MLVFVLFMLLLLFLFFKSVRELKTLIEKGDRVTASVIKRRRCWLVNTGYKLTCKCSDGRKLKVKVSYEEGREYAVGSDIQLLVYEKLTIVDDDKAERNLVGMYEEAMNKR